MRGSWQTTVIDESGDIQAGKAITLYETDGTTPLAQSVYDAASGGAPNPSPQTSSLGEITLYADTPQYITYKVAGGTVKPGRIDPDPDQIVLLSANQTVSGKTFSGNTYVAPTMTGSGTFVDLAGTGTLAALGVASGGFGGARVNQYGGLTLGRQVALGDVAQALLVANIDSATNAAQQTIYGAFNNRANAVDTAGHTFTTSEGWNSAWGIPTGPAANLLSLEQRLVIGTYPGIIIQGHGGSRAVGGFGMSTQTQQAALSDGQHADEEVVLKLDNDGRSAFPPLLPDNVTPNPNADGVPVGTILLLKGYSDCYFMMMGLKPAGGGVPNDPTFAMDKHARLGLWTVAAAMLHAKRNTNILGANVPVEIVEGDNTGTVANQLRIRGTTATTKRLTLGYDTTSNWGTVDADSNGTGSPLLLNPTGGKVYVGTSTTATGGAPAAFTVKQLADDINSGLSVVSVGTGTKTSAVIYSTAYVGAGNGGLTRWYANIPGFSSSWVTMSGEPTQTAWRIDAASGQTANVAEWAINGGSVLASISRYGHINGTVQGVSTFVKAGTPSDADFSTAPPVGTLVVDTTGNKIWARTGAATWKGGAIA